MQTVTAVLGQRFVAACAAAALLGAGCTEATPADQNPADSAPPSISMPTATPEGSEEDDPDDPSDPSVELGAPERLRPSEWVMPYRAGRMVVGFWGRPDPAAIEDLLAALEERSVTASFFIPGRWISTHPDEAAAIVSDGHALGSAGWKGRAPTKRTALRRWIRKGEDAIAAVGIDPRPFLSLPRRDQAALTVAGRLGYRNVLPTPDAMTSLRDGGGVVARLSVRDKPLRSLRRLLRVAEKTEVEPVGLDRLTAMKPVAWDVALVPGAEGPKVERLQRVLNSNRYAAGTPDGVFGSLTQQAVYAFEKFHGLERDGIDDPSQLGDMLMSPPPKVETELEAHHFTIDITRQLLFEFDGGEVVRVVAMSSANGQPYESRGNTYVARTPRGTFEIERKISDWRISHLGALYYPSYFVGGYAVHGSTSVPPYPASHGCIRVPMGLAVDIYERMALGTPVIVHD